MALAWPRLGHLCPWSSPAPSPLLDASIGGVPRVAFSSSPAVHQDLPWPHSAVWVGGCPPPARVLRPVPLIGGLAKAGSPGAAPGRRNLAWRFRRLGSGHCPPGHLYRLFPSTPSERNGSLRKGRSPSTPSFSLPEWYLRFADSPLPHGRVLLGADTRARPSLAFVRSAAAQPFRHLSLTATPPLASLPSLEHAMLVAPHRAFALPSPLPGGSSLTLLGWFPRGPSPAPRPALFPRPPA